MNENIAVDWKAIRSRVAYAVEVLDLDPAEVDQASSDDGLEAFARRYHQSGDWLVDGDPRVMIARCAVG